MKTATKHLSKTKVELTITLDREDLDAARQVALTKLSKDLKIAGFRKGAAPTAVVAKNVDPNTLADQVLDDAISKAVAEAFLSTKLQALERPEVTVKKYVPGETLEFTAEVDVMPEVKLGDYKHLTTKPAKSTVTAAEVNEIIERMRAAYAEKKPVTRAAKDGDETTIDFVGKKDGVAFAGGTASDYDLTLGSNSFIPGFEEGIVGHKPGDTFDLDLTFPEDYQAKDLAGTTVTFTVTLKSIQELVLPEINDEFAAKAGPFTSVAELKADIKRELGDQKEREAIEQLKDQLAEELVSISTVPVPEALVHDQIHSLQRDVQQNLSYQGRTLEDYLAEKGLTAEEWHDSQELRDQATRRIQIGLALAELSKVEKIEATSEELADHLNLYKSQYANDPETLKQFDTAEVQQQVANRLLTEKTIDRLVELNK